MWGATTQKVRLPPAPVISIHAPRVGSDASIASKASARSKFQSTLPVWGATLVKLLYLMGLLFQSTLPVWGATLFISCPVRSFMHFNPRSPCGERPPLFASNVNKYFISIHAPRVGSDRGTSEISPVSSISIHAPRVGSDKLAGTFLAPASKFQSTLPVWGATLTLALAPVSTLHFNPRSPCGERPSYPVHSDALQDISIHAPRVGSD